MLDDTVPTPKLILPEQPKTDITSAVFNRPLPVGVGSGLEQLGAGLDDLATPLAKNQGEQDAASAVTRNPDGSLTVTPHPASPILGRPGLAYQQALETGLVSASRSSAEDDLAKMATQYQNQPDQFRAAAGSYVDGIKANNPGPVGIAMAQYAQSVADQHFTGLTTQAQKDAFAATGALNDSRVTRLENQMDGLAAQGAINSSAFLAAQKERDGILAAKVANPAYSYSADQRGVDDANFQTRINVATLTGSARDEAIKTGNTAQALQNLNTGLDKLPISETQKLSYLGEVTRHLSAMTAIDAQQKAELTDRSNSLIFLGKAHPDSVTPQQYDDMSLQLERSKLFAESGAVQEAKIHGTIISPMITGGSVQDAIDGLNEVRAMALGRSAPGASGRGLIDAAYGRPVDQPAQSGLSPQTMYSYLLGKGATKNEALLLTGAAGSEGVYNPQAIHDNGIGYGLFGHNGDRLDAMRQAAGSFTPSWQQQADFALKELRGRPEGAAANSATSADQLADAEMAYERPRAYTPADPRAGENYTGRLNTIRYLAQNLQNAPSIGPGDQTQPGEGGPLAVRYSLALKEAQDAYNAKTKTLWDGMEKAYDAQQMPTPTEQSQLRMLMPLLSDDSLRDKITQRLGTVQALAATKTLPVAQQQDLAATLTQTAQQGGLGPIERQLVQPIAEQVQQQVKLAKADPVSLAVLKTPPQVAKEQNLPAMTPLDPNDPQGFAAGLRARQTWKAVAQADPAAGNMPLRSTDLSAMTTVAPNWTGQQAQTALGTMGATLTGPEQDALMGDKSFKTMVTGWARSGDPLKMNAAYSFLDAQYRRNPMTFSAEDGGQTLKDLRTWQTLSSFKDPVTVAKQMAEANDPDVVKAKDALGEVAEKNLANLDTSNIVRQVYGAHVPLIGSYIPFTSPGDIASDAPAQASGALLADYKAAYTDMYKETGDAGASDSYAKEVLGNKYSASPINGGRVMAYAPDRTATDPNGAGEVGAYYPMVNGSFDWLRQQLTSDVMNSRFAHDYRLDHPGAAPPQYALLPDAKTQADIAAKRPPSYQVIAVGNDGRFHLIEGDTPGQAMRFRGDPTMAQQQADTQATAQREADQAAAADPMSPSGGT